MITTLTLPNATITEIKTLLHKICKCFCFYTIIYAYSNSAAYIHDAIWPSCFKYFNFWNSCRPQVLSIKTGTEAASRYTFPSIYYILFYFLHEFFFFVTFYIILFCSVGHLVYSIAISKIFVQKRSPNFQWRWKIQKN